MTSTETALPPMLLHDHPVDLHGAGEPAGRSLLPPTEAAASAGGEAGAGADGGAATGAGGGPELGKVPHLPSIKESMPFLSSLGEPAAGKLGEAGAAAECEGVGTRDPAAGVRLQLSPPFGSKQIRESDVAHRLPPLMPASATSSTNSSPAVCPQCPPNRDPARADLKSPGSKEHSSSPEGEVPERVGGMDWGERRKKLKREQMFESTCPRSQRVAHLKLSISKLLHALPHSEKQPFLGDVQRYMGGETSPEDFAEQVKALVDTHHIMIPMECPAPARKPVESRTVKTEGSADESVFAKPSNKRASAGGDTGRRSKAPKGPSAKSATGKLPAGAAYGERGGGAAGGSSRTSSKKRKQPSPEEEKRERQGSSSRKGGGLYRGASGKVLHGALTPVSATYIKEEADDDEEEEDKGAESADEEENSAWDALLSVCAQMPRQKAK